MTMRRFDPLSVALWAAALFLAVVLFSHTIAIRLLLLFVGVALVVVELVRSALQGDHAAIRPLPPLAIPFVLWAAWAALSFTWSQEPERTLKELRNEIGYAFLAFWLCYAAAQARNAACVILPILALGATAVCGIALFEFWFRPQEAYAVGLHGGAGSHASALLVLMPCTLMFAWAARGEAWTRWILAMPWVLPVVYLASAYTTLNRTVWIGFAVQIVILGALLLARRNDIRRRTLLPAGAAAALVLAAGVSMTLYVHEERFATSGGAPSLGQDPRLALWSSIIAKIEERPLTGLGFGRGIVRHSLREEFDLPELWHSHNLILETAMQLGLPGVAFLMLLLGATVWRGWRLARGPDAVAAACGIALIAVVAGMLVRNMTDMLWVRQNALLYWSVVGVLLAWGQTAAAKARAS